MRPINAGWASWSRCCQSPEPRDLKLPLPLFEERSFARMRPDVVRSDSQRQSFCRAVATKFV